MDWGTGMLWSRVLLEVHCLSRLDRASDVLVLHVGGNDLGVTSMRDLISNLKVDFLRLRTTFPGMMIVWSDMVGRTAWCWAWLVNKVDKACVKVNKEVGKFVTRNGGIIIRHRELEGNTWRYIWSDGVHLNAVRIDLWALGLKEEILRALRVWGGMQG